MEAGTLSSVLGYLLKPPTSTSHGCNGSRGAQGMAAFPPPPPPASAPHHPCQFPRAPALTTVRTRLPLGSTPAAGLVTPGCWLHAQTPPSPAHAARGQKQSRTYLNSRARLSRERDLKRKLFPCFSASTSGSRTGPRPQQTRPPRSPASAGVAPAEPPQLSPRPPRFLQAGSGDAKAPGAELS